MNQATSHSFRGDFSVALPLNGFTNTTVLVIGDLMLDRYISGEVTRISPEAPVPVVSVQGQRTVAGGAANVALNVAGLGARTLVAGVIGEDSSGQRLTEILNTSTIDTRGLLVASERPTTCKTRIICGNHQIARLDEEVLDELPSSIREKFLEQVWWLLADGVNLVILSDYGKGVLSAELLKAVIAECVLLGVPVVVDPKRLDYSPYSRATCITPNQKEFSASLAAMSISDRDFATAAGELRSRLGCGTLLVTQGAKGMTLVTAEQLHHFPALAQEVFDVSGAGDTVIAVFATAVSAGFNFIDAVRLSNIAASIVVQRAGTTPIAWNDLYALIAGDEARMIKQDLREPAATLSRAAGLQ